MREIARQAPAFLIGLMTCVLALAVFFPHGIVNFEKLESNIVFIAEREGAANCMITLKLRENKTFKSREVCFGIDETTGAYEIKGDTVFFKSNSWGTKENIFYEFGVLDPAKSAKERYPDRLTLFRDKSDTKGLHLRIIKNNLAK